MSLTLLATADGGRWMFLSLSVLLLGAGPLLFWALGRRRWALEALDGFVLVSLLGLLALHVVPGAVLAGRGWAILALAAGAVMPTLLERAQRLRHRHTHAAVLALGMLGLGVHTALDGAALAMTGAQTDGAAMALAIVLHRVPVGLAIWWLIFPRHGLRAAIGAMVGVAVMTTLGFGLGAQWHSALSGGALALFQAFVAGTLLHVLTHHGPGETTHEHDHEHAHEHDLTRSHDAPESWAIAETIGAAIGALTVAVLPLLTGLDHGGDAPAYHDDHYHHTSQAGHAAHEHLSHAADVAHGAHGHVEVALDAYMQRLLHLALETAPALALGLALAGLLVALLPRVSARWLRGRGAPGQAARGVLVGLPVPVCSWGVVPLYKRLVRQGAPPAAALAFLIATPTLGIEALLLSMPLLGARLTLARLGAAAIVALVVGWGLGRLLSAHTPDTPQEEDAAPPEPWPARLRRAARFVAVDLIDDTIAWVLLGLAIAAALEPTTLPEILSGMFGAHVSGLDVVLFAIVGLPMHVCASGATPLAAAFIFAGASPGAALAFLITGPASNTRALGALAALYGKRRASLFAAAVIVLAIGLGLLANALLGAHPTAPSHPTNHTAFTALHWLSLALVTLATLAAILRNGPRALLRTIVDLGGR